MTYTDPAAIARLRERIWALEQGSRAPPPVLAIGAPDAALPWGGLPLGRLHQLVAQDEAALGFAAALLAMVACGRPVLWCRRKDRAAPFLPGLAAFGLTSAQVLVAEAERAVGILWAMEEGLRCPALGAVLGETEALPPAAARRLQLAAETGGVTGLAVTPAHAPDAGATTRWRIAAAPSAPTPWGGLGPPAWQVALERCRGGPPRAWALEWRGGAFAESETNRQGPPTHPAPTPTHPTPTPLHRGEGIHFKSPPPCGEGQGEGDAAIGSLSSRSGA